MKWISYVHDADNGSETDVHETREAAEASVEKWLDHCRDYAHDDGWPLDMTAHVALVVSELFESTTEAPEDSSFDHFADYHMVPVPDERDARIAALEAEVESLRADLARERGSRAEVPTHADIDACPDPVAAVERVTGRMWAPFAGDAWAINDGGDDFALAAPHQWRAYFGGVEIVGKDSSVEDARVSASRAFLHALLDGRAEFPEGAPGWGAWTNDAPQGAF
jgi:uncharacterized small protein (DUF1192 family)